MWQKVWTLACLAAGAFLSSVGSQASRISVTDSLRREQLAQSRIVDMSHPVRTSSEHSWSGSLIDAAHSRDVVHVIIFVSLRPHLSISSRLATYIWG